MLLKYVTKKQELILDDEVYVRHEFSYRDKKLDGYCD